MPAEAASTPSGIEAAIDELYKLDLDGFTHHRNALAKLLKSEGHTADAERVKRLKKPSVSAWIVNQLWWRHRTEFDALLETSRHLGEATGRGTILPGAAAQARRQVLDPLMAKARDLLEASHKSASPALVRRISTTLEACAARADHLPEPGPGRWSEDLDPPGFEALASMMMGTSPRSSERIVEEDPAPPSQEATRHAQEMVDLARQRLRLALHAVEEKRGHADRTTTERLALEERWAHTRAALEAAQRAENRAREELDAAQERSQRAQEALTGHQAALEEAQEALRRAEEALAEVERNAPPAG